MNGEGWGATSIEFKPNGRSACRCVDRSVAVCGRCGPIFPTIASLGSYFFIEDEEIYIVHGFIKKTPKTPSGDMELARRRLKETKA